MAYPKCRNKQTKKYNYHWYLLPPQGGNTVPEAMKWVFDVVTPSPLKFIMVSPFVKAPLYGKPRVLSTMRHSLYNHSIITARLAPHSSPTQMTHNSHMRLVSHNWLQTLYVLHNKYNTYTLAIISSCCFPSDFGDVAVYIYLVILFTHGDNGSDLKFYSIYTEMS